MEEGKTYKLQIVFTLDVPKRVDDSDFNSLILRMNELSMFREEDHNREEEYMANNENISAMQILLENFKYKRF